MAVDVEFARWAEVDPWWDAFSDASSSGLWSDIASITDTEAYAENWWETHIESQRDSLVKLQAGLESAQTVWAESRSRFDSDPLAADWASSSETTGPLRTNQEENWSRWFAHLIRAGPPEFSRALFGDGFDTTRVRWSVKSISRATTTSTDTQMSSPSTTDGPFRSR